MKTGLVMEIDQKGRATVLEVGGQFVQVPAQAAWQLGDVVQLRPARAAAKPWVALAACLLLVLAGTVGNWLYFSRATLISVDVNPSVELWLNRLDQVVAVEGLNQQGQELALQVDLRNQSYTKALELLFSSEYLAQYLAGDPEVTITVMSQPGREISLLASAEKTAGNALQSQNTTARVECFSVDRQLVENAHCHGVTAGKYLYLLELQEAAPDIDINEYAQQSIGEIQCQIDECRRNHGRQGGGQGQGHGGPRGHGGGHGGHGHQ